MAKELGQIHTVNYTQRVTFGGAVAQNAILVDLPGQLTSQLQTLIRWGTYHKVVGIDITLDRLQGFPVGATRGGQVSGYIRYYAPTKGRCEAVRGAFDAMKTVMKNQGISMSDNRMYDFKAPINEEIHLSGDFENQATLDGVSGLALFNSSNPPASIFNVHNESVRPVQDSTADLFSSGFSTLQNPVGGTDFVLNDTVAYSGNRDGASTEYETIPFQCTYDPDSGNVTTFQWRPDPALYLAILCGQMSVVVQNIEFDGEPTPTTGLDLNLSVMVSGWKSIMSKPKSRRSKSSKKKMK